MARRHKRLSDTVGDRIKDLTTPANPLQPATEPLPFERPWDKSITAQFLGVTPSGLDKLVKEGKAPPHFKVGRRLRWRPSIVKMWAAEQEERAAEAKQAQK